MIIFPLELDNFKCLQYSFCKNKSRDKKRYDGIVRKQLYTELKGKYVTEVNKNCITEPILGTFENMQTSTRYYLM